MTEQQIQAKIIKYLSSDGWLVFKTVKVVPNGYPDVIAHKGGNTILVEVKTPQGRTSEIQKEQHRRLRGQGITVYVVNSLQGFINELTISD